MRRRFFSAARRQAGTGEVRSRGAACRKRRRSRLLVTPSPGQNLYSNRRWPEHLLSNQAQKPRSTRQRPTSWRQTFDAAWVLPSVGTAKFWIVVRDHVEAARAVVIEAAAAPVVIGKIACSASALTVSIGCKAFARISIPVASRGPGREKYPLASSA